MLGENVTKTVALTMVGVSLVQTLTIYGLKRRLDRGRKNFNQLHESTMYLIGLLEQHGVELTEFDAIALNAINEG